MSSEPIRHLRDFVSLVRGTTYKGDLVGSPGPVLLGLASIQTDGGFRRGSFKTYGGECPQKITLGPGDLYVSLKDVTQSGDLLGSVARVPGDIANGRLTQDTVKLDFHNSEVNRSYIYWLLRTPEYRSYCRARATGTTTLGLARDDFLDFPVPEASQVELDLVELLEALEAHIVGLSETNATLEAIAQALFKSWFVDFDPVRAKMAGRAPEGIDEAMVALFPDALEKTELGLVPVGWRAGLLADVVESIFSGGTPDTRRPEFWGGAIPWFSSGETRNTVVTRTEKTITPAGVKGSSTRAAIFGDVLIASAGQGHTRGQTSYCGIECFINQSVVAVRAGKKSTSSWLFFNLKRRYNEMRNLSDSHSSRGSLTTKLLAGMPVVIPPVELLTAFEDTVSALLSSVILNELRAENLAALRDRLLPRLLSGQLRLPEAQAQLEEAFA